MVWEHKSEAIVELCETELPVLKEVVECAISASEGQPTNILIEGDNYHALSVLNYTHKEKIDVIYIDPPYNTGNKSWKYNNDYIDKDDSFRHSKWLSFMEKRLRLAKNLLKETGIIICAIDDYEFAGLKLLFDDIFGEQNRLGTVVVIHNPRGRNDDKYFATMHEYALFYSKGNEAEVKKFEHTIENIDKEFPYEDNISKYGLVSYMRTGNNSDRHTRPNLYYPIYVSRNNDISLNKKMDCIEIYPINSKGQEKTWRWSKDTLEGKFEDILVKRVKNGISLFKKRRPEIVGGKKPKTVWYDPKYDASSHGISLLEKILEQKDTFPYPKSLFNILDILKITTNSNSIILDFFAGSGTTGHAVLELNKEDGGDRQFILCTNNENSICEEVTYPRIEKVIKGYGQQEGIPANLRYFKAEFVENKGNRSQLKKDFTAKSEDMLRIKENCFDFIKKGKQYKIFCDATKQTYLGIFFDFFTDKEFEVFVEELKKLDKKAKKKIYIFSLDNFADNSLFTGVKNFSLEPIPEKILNIYKQLSREIKK